MSIFRRWFTKGKNRITRRLDKKKDTMTFRPTYSASNIQYEVSDKIRGITCGGIGAMHLLARHIGLIDAIDQRLHLLKFHLPYHESDHVLNFAYNALCNGTCLQDIELRRNDENYLDALGTCRIPDPTTAGDFCRRFTLEDIDTFIDIINEVRLKVWAQQPDDFFDCAKIDMDGTHVTTTGEYKEGIDISYKGGWCYHPLAVTLANTGEVLSIVNRPGNRPSHEGAAEEADRVVQLCGQAGFRKIVLRGDTDFSQTRHLDGWDSDPRIRFYFGYDSKKNLEEIADNLSKSVPARRDCSVTLATRSRRNRAEGGPTLKNRLSRNVNSRTSIWCRKMWPSSTTGRQPAAKPTGWWWFARTSRWKRASRFSSLRSATSSTSPTNGNVRRNKWFSKQTTVAIKKTTSPN